MSPVRESGMPYLELAADCGRMTSHSEVIHTYGAVVV